jgi:hypothetical protein
VFKASSPRVVLVTRQTIYQELLARHGTPRQAAFYVKSRGQSIENFELADREHDEAIQEVEAAIPADQRRVHVDRALLPRFLFAPDDLVVIIGQDGLVPNAAKYLNGQLTIGINPDPQSYDGVLCCHPPDVLPRFLSWTRNRDGRFRVEKRTMAVARREDGQELRALNEVFIGHQTHQSARYQIRYRGATERHSSSGVICATGTGATGWARSIARQRQGEIKLPRPQDRDLTFFVREPFPSVATQTSIEAGPIPAGEPLILESEMSERGVVFADGIEEDRLEFIKGQTLEIGVAEQQLFLVVPGKAPARR